jgi:hypothetical protein
LRVDALANPSLQRLLPIVPAVVAALGATLLVGALLAARRPLGAQARVFRRRVAVVGLFTLVAGGAAFAVLRTPVDSGFGVGGAAGRLGDASDGGGGEVEVASERRFSSAKLPALSLDAPAGWTLELDRAARKLTAAGGGARLLVSTAILTEAVDVQVLLAKLADTQRTLGFEVGDTFSDLTGNLPAAGFLAKGPSRSVAVWMVKRDTHLASSLICTAEGKGTVTAREACRAPLAALRWRTPGR